MTEKELYESIVKNRILDDDTIKRAARTAIPKKRGVFDRILKPVIAIPVAAALLLSIALMIPSARAEVFSWFSPASAQDYLSADPGERTPDPELDAMITGPDLAETEIKVNYVADEPYWREIGKNFSATLGETAYDGQSIYISVNFDGLSGYAMFENMWAAEVSAGTPLPSLLAEKVDPEMVCYYHEDYSDMTPFLSGAMEHWNGPDNFLFLTLEDGTHLWAQAEAVRRPVDDAFRQALTNEFGTDDFFTKDAARAFRERAWEHVKENGLRAISNVHMPDPETYRFYPDNGKTLADSIDEDGFLTLRVNYRVSIDHGEDSETKLDIDLGTVKINMTAYRNAKQRQIEMPDDAVSLSGDVVFGGCGFDGQRRFRVANYPANLDGVALRVVSPGVVDIFGIHDLKILITMPDDWSEEMKKAFADELSFDIRIDGDLTVNSGSRSDRNDSDSYTLTLNIVDTIPFERIRSMQTITLTPCIQWYLNAKISKVLPDGSLEPVRIVPIAADGFFDEATLEPGTPVGYDGESRDFPEYAITLYVR